MRPTRPKPRAPSKAHLILPGWLPDPAAIHYVLDIREAQPCSYLVFLGSLATPPGCTSALELPMGSQELRGAQGASALYLLLANDSCLVIFIPSPPRPPSANIQLSSFCRVHGVRMQLRGPSGPPLQAEAAHTSCQAVLRTCSCLRDPQCHTRALPWHVGGRCPGQHPPGTIMGTRARNTAGPAASHHTSHPPLVGAASCHGLPGHR